MFRLHIMFWARGTMGLFDIPHSLVKASLLFGLCLMHNHSCPLDHIPLKDFLVESLVCFDLTVSLFIRQGEKIH